MSDNNEEPAVVVILAKHGCVMGVFPQSMLCDLIGYSPDGVSKWLVNHGWVALDAETQKDHPVHTHKQAHLWKDHTKMFFRETEHAVWDPAKAADAEKTK